MTHEEFNAKVRVMAEEYHVSELMARCYLYNWYTLHRCDRCGNRDECSFVYALEKDKEKNNEV